MGYRSISKIWQTSTGERWSQSIAPRPKGCRIAHSRLSREQKAGVGGAIGSSLQHRSASPRAPNRFQQGPEELNLVRRRRFAESTSEVVVSDLGMPIIERLNIDYLIIYAGIPTNASHVGSRVAQPRQIIVTKQWLSPIESSGPSLWHFYRLRLHLFSFAPLSKLFLKT